MHDSAYDVNLIKYPNPILKKVALKVTEFGEPLKKRAYAMFKIMYDFNGIGLAANQVGILERVIVVHGKLINNTKSWKTYVNPEILSSSGEFTYEEGCLSHPGIRIKITRPKIIQLKYQDVEGKEFTETIESVEGMVHAQVVQHEIDHINGINLIEHMTAGQAMLNDKKLYKLEKEYRKGR